MSNELRYLARDLIPVARAGVPQEVCGVVYRNWTWRQMRNASASPCDSFDFADDELLEEFGSGWDHILAIWHSHPRGTPRPSPRDEEFPYADLRYFIVTAFDLYEWGFKNGSAYPIDPLTGAAGAPQLAYPVLAGSTQG